MIGPKLSVQKKFSLMEARQQQALRQEELALDATRAKTARLRAQRLAKENQDAIAAAASKPPSARKRPAQPRKAASSGA